VKGWLRRAAAACALAMLASACAPSAPDAAGPDLAVLAQGAEGFVQARPGTILQFPDDHGAHPEFRIEWWYLTANLEDAAGRPYGAQWTLFRFAMHQPGERAATTPWQDGQVFMAHVGITSPTDHQAFQRYARGGDHGGIRQAGVTSRPFAAWLDDWSLASTTAEWLPLRVFAQQNRHGIDLILDSDGPLVLQGEAGFSQKHPDGGGSYYYSQPFLGVHGHLLIDGEAIAVRGQGWLDREWSSQFLQTDQVGWDWFALHLDSGEKLMLFRLRGRTGSADFRHGVLIGGQGDRRTLEPSLIGLEVMKDTEVAGRRLPLHWRVSLPEIDRELKVEALHPRQWMDVDFPYWEGAARVSGEGPGSRGVGYMELTGYRPD